MPLGIFSKIFATFKIIFIISNLKDVLKTRMMNAPPGTYKGIMDCARDIGKVGPAGFFKGFD